MNQGYGDDLHGQLPSSPSKPHKCQYCSKRYKTPAGLTNHVNQAHQKTSGGRGDSVSCVRIQVYYSGYAGQNPEQAPSSPTVLAQLITQAQAERQHRTAMEQQQVNFRSVLLETSQLIPATYNNNNNEFESDDVDRLTRFLTTLPHFQDLIVFHFLQ